jgi:hypothetical protein
LRHGTDAANNQDAEEHTTFWLVVADQLGKRGIVCDLARDKAVRIITSRPGGQKHAVISALIEILSAQFIAILGTRVGVDTIRSAE